MQLSSPKILFIRIYKNFLPVSGFGVLLGKFWGFSEPLLNNSWFQHVYNPSFCSFLVLT